MIFSTDDYFHIGQLHLVQGKPCQDYAFSAVYERVGLAVVADGCSSGRHTDIGSRILALSTAAAVKQLNFSGSKEIEKKIRFQQEHLVKLTRESLNLELADMLATCGYICLSPGGGFVHLRGDGAIAISDKSGAVRLISCQWHSNTPFYPAYTAEHYANFVRHHGGDPSTNAFKIEYWKTFDSQTFLQEKEEHLSIADGANGLFLELLPEEMKKITYAAVFTDGVMQIGKIAGEENDLVNWKEVLCQLMAFKNSTGEFAKRRIIRFLKDQQKNGKVPLDDIAYAVVKIISDEEPQDA